MPKKKKIDYSLLPLAKKKTIRSPKHLNFVRSLPCSVCKTDYSQDQYFLHRTAQPLDEVDFNKNDKQIDFFNEECTGFCGN